MANFYKKSQVADDAAVRVGGKEKASDVVVLGGCDGEKKQNQLGRSMIEMLGVLAIIGVLSLGSISAYSQAMFKYQLNKFTEDFSTLLNNAISLLPELQRQYGKGSADAVKLSSFFADTSLLPGNMYYDKKSDSIYDIFKNQSRIIYVLYQDVNTPQTEYYINFTMNKSGDKISSRDHQICRNILLVAKENAANIYAVRLHNSNGQGTTTGTSYIYGDMATWGPKKLRNASLNEIDEVCNFCDSEKFCGLAVYLNVTKR